MLALTIVKKRGLGWMVRVIATTTWGCEARTKALGGSFLRSSTWSGAIVTGLEESVIKTDFAKSISVALVAMAGGS